MHEVKHGTSNDNKLYLLIRLKVYKSCISTLSVEIQLSTHLVENWLTLRDCALDILIRENHRDISLSSPIVGLTIELL